MTTDRDFDRIAMAWLADGPEELSDRVLDSVVDRIHSTRQRRALRVPWRFRTMTMPARVVALIAVGALVIAGALAVAGIGGQSGPVPTALPSAAANPSAAPSAVVLPALDASFTSPRHGYTVKYPSGWTVTPATKAWARGTTTLWGDPAIDEIKGSSLSSTHPSGDVRLVGTQQAFAGGQTADTWLKAYCAEDATADCSNVPASWPTTQVAGYTAYVDLNGVPAAGGTIVPGGRIYDVIVPVSGRAYVFTFDGVVDRATVDAFLAGVSLMPADAVDTPPLTGTFTSPIYGYSIGTLPEWIVTPSTKAGTGPIDDNAFMDGIDNTGADGLGAMSRPLGNRSFDAFLAAFEADQAAVGCGGGDPATWQTVQIGDRTGVFYDACLSAKAFAQAGDRAYFFELGHAGSGDRFSLAEFKQLLTSVTFDPASAK